MEGTGVARTRQPTEAVEVATPTTTNRRRMSKRVRFLRPVSPAVSPSLLREVGA
jgi:hypothetical protein